MPRIYFASNRDVKHETSSKGNVFGDGINQTRPQCFRVGWSDVEFSGGPNGDARDDDKWSVGQTELYPEDLDSRRTDGPKLGSAAMFDDLRKLLKEDASDVLIYIHGFANSFQNTMVRAAALQKLYSTEDQSIVVVCFSWPSNGKVQPAWNYFSDRDDAKASGIAMGRALVRLVEFLADVRREDQQTILEARRQGHVPDPKKLKQCTRRLHVLAHSMGNWALRSAVQRYLEEENRTARIFDCAFLMAADEDNDALQKSLKLRPLDALANRIFVYHANNDIALTISDTTKGMPDRLGADGPENFAEVSERVMSVDCRKVSGTSDISHGRHQYYRLREEVIRDVRMTLADEAQEERPGRVAQQPGRSWLLKSDGGTG